MEYAKYFEKAFDSLEWSFLFKFLTAFCKWINVFYTNITSCVLNCETTSQYFPVTRGVRQGDPLSPFLFILAVEVIAVTINADPNIKGITVKQKETKLIQLSNDTGNGCNGWKKVGKTLNQTSIRVCKNLWPENKQRKKPKTLDWKRQRLR